MSWQKNIRNIVASVAIATSSFTPACKTESSTIEKIYEKIPCPQDNSKICAEGVETSGKSKHRLTDFGVNTLLTAGMKKEDIESIAAKRPIFAARLVHIDGQLDRINYSKRDELRSFKGFEHITAERVDKLENLIQKDDFFGFEAYRDFFIIDALRLGTPSDYIAGLIKDHKYFYKSQDSPSLTLMLYEISKDPASFACLEQINEIVLGMEKPEQTLRQALRKGTLCKLTQYTGSEYWAGVFFEAGIEPSVVNPYVKAISENPAGGNVSHEDIIKLIKARTSAGTFEKYLKLSDACNVYGEITADNVLALQSTGLNFRQVADVLIALNINQERNNENCNKATATAIANGTYKSMEVKN